MAAESVSRDHFFIGGAWVAPSSDRRFQLVDASTEAPLGSVPEGVEADVDRAVAAARAALDDRAGWSSRSPAERAEAMACFSAALKKRCAELARAVSRQNGMPISLSTTFEGGGFSIGVLDYYTQLAEVLQEHEVRASQMGRETIVTRASIGVVAAIVPWNFPVTLAITKIAPALATGCTLVIKPSPGTVLDSYILADAAAEAGLPPGVLNWVAADRAVGGYLVSHPGIDKVAFTGSTAAGRAIARACAERLRPVTLELGGKSAAIILDDADLDAVTQGLPMVSLLNNGQGCYNCTRVLAPRSRYTEVIDALASMAASLVVGNAMDADTQVGPMASAAQRERVERYIAAGKAEARLVTGGGRPEGLDRGWFIQPTIFADVSNRATIAREEIFGPVLSVIPYMDDDEAVRIANDTDYGLGGSIWSNDETRARRLAARVRTGTIGINGYVPSIGSPFGGIKASGLGRELGPEALDTYQQIKTTYVMA